jgi:hypothetical protein
VFVGIDFQAAGHPSRVSLLRANRRARGFDGLNQFGRPIFGGSVKARLPDRRTGGLLKNLS